MQCVFLNGKILAPETAFVSVFDRGFIFGDGVYEVIPIYGGHLFRLQHHLERLENSLNSIGIINPLTHEEWTDMFAQLIQKNGGGDLYIYTQVTRGVAARDHAFPANIAPTVFAYAQKLPLADKRQLQEGVSAITTEDIRWARCDIKAIALLPNVLMRQEAVTQGATEAILIRNDLVTEGAASNIFVVRDSQIVTPPKGPYTLPGVTRDLILELAKAHALTCREAPVTQAQLLEADEVWLASSIKEIMPIVRINGRIIGKGKPGPMHATMYAFYQDYKQTLRMGSHEA